MRYGKRGGLMSEWAGGLMRHGKRGRMMLVGVRSDEI